MGFIAWLKSLTTPHHPNLVEVPFKSSTAHQCPYGLETCTDLFCENISDCAMMKCITEGDWRVIFRDGKGRE